MPNIVKPQAPLKSNMVFSDSVFISVKEGSDRKHPLILATVRKLNLMGSCCSRTNLEPESLRQLKQFLNSFSLQGEVF